jgi:DNA-binding response OmpR family regulator
MAANRILIVHNAQDIVKTLSPMLRARSYAVIDASGGEEGLQKARNERPDLILLEDTISDMSSYDVCKRLKSDRVTRNIPVIIVSASDESESVRNAHSAGADDYIVKPFNLITLLSKLKKFLVR